MCKSFRCLAASLLFMFAAGVQAQANDNWSNATTIGSLPFSTSEPNMYQATVETSDPEPPCLPVLGGVTTSAEYTLWYSYTTGPSTEYITLTMGYNKPVSGIVSVYTGNPTDGFRIVSGGCGTQSDTDATTRIAGLRLAANTTYSIEVASYHSLTSSSNDALNFSVDSAQQYIVTNTTDTNRGTCANSDCSLREAIGASNANPGAVLIPAGTYALTIPGAEEYLNATGSLDALHGMGIYGAGMQQTIIDANQLDRVFVLDPPANSSTRTSFAIGDLTITHGSSIASVMSGHTQDGGGLVLKSGTDYLGMERVALTSNLATNAGNGGGGMGGGAAINSSGTLRDCVVSNNTSNYFGGGGLNISTNDGRYFEISGSTISGNSETDQAGGAGGGIYAFGTLYVSNSTISGNHTNGDGGGIDVEGSGGSLHMASSTVVFNTAQVNPYKTDAGAGVNMAGTDPNTIINSILAYNTVANPTDPPDCALSGGTMTSSYNHVGSISTTCTFVGAGDVTGSDPGVSHLLGNYGGLTPTHALLSDSPAQDSADPGGCRDADGMLLVYDQRGVGFPRIGNGRCDKGAFEFIDEIFGNGFN